MLSRRLCASLAVLGLLVAGCARREQKTTITDRQERVPIEYTLKITGDVQANLKRTVESKFIVYRTNNKQAESMQIMGVQPIDPMVVGGMAIRPGVTVIPFRGDGRYRADPSADKAPDIAGKDLGSATAQATPKTSVELEWWPTAKLDTYPANFLRRLKQCVVDVDSGGEKGHAKCDKLTLQGEERTVNVDIRWQVKGKGTPVTQPPQPTPPPSTEPTK